MAERKLQNGAAPFTVLCRNWPGKCAHGEKCYFLHGTMDARALRAMRKAKTEEQPEPPHSINTQTSPELLLWLKDRLFSAKVSADMPSASKQHCDVIPCLTRHPHVYDCGLVLAALRNCCRAQALPSTL
jgi:hypothetical protein